MKNLKKALVLLVLFQTATNTSLPEMSNKFSSYKKYSHLAPMKMFLTGMIGLYPLVNKSLKQGFKTDISRLYTFPVKSENAQIARKYLIDLYRSGFHKKLLFNKAATLWLPVMALTTEMKNIYRYNFPKSKSSISPASKKNQSWF